MYVILFTLDVTLDDSKSFDYARLSITDIKILMSRHYCW